MRDTDNKSKTTPEDEFKTHPDVLESINHLDGSLGNLVQLAHETNALAKETNEKVAELLGFANMVKGTIDEWKGPVTELLTKVKWAIYIAIGCAIAGTLSLVTIAYRLING